MLFQISNSSSGITIKNIQNADLNGNNILEASEQPISEEPVSEEPVSSEIETSDNRLCESSPDTVYQSSPFIDIGGKDNVRYRNVMLFDLSKYNSDSQVDNAILSLYWYYPPGNTRSEDTVIEIYRPAYAWDSNNVGWSKRDNGVAWKNPGGDWYDKNGVLQGSTPYATLTFKGSDFPDNRYYELDITDLVKEYTSGKYENTGFFIKARTESNDYIAFYSSDYGNESQVPKLQLNTVFVQNGKIVSSGSKEENPLQAFFSSMTTYYKDVIESLFAYFC